MAEMERKQEATKAPVAATTEDSETPAANDSAELLTDSVTQVHCNSDTASGAIEHSLMGRGDSSPESLQTSNITIPKAAALTGTTLAHPVVTSSFPACLAETASVGVASSDTDTVRRQVDHASLMNGGSIFVSAPSMPASSTQSGTDARVITGHEYAQSVERWLWQQYWWMQMQQMNWMTWMYVTTQMAAAASCLPPTSTSTAQAQTTMMRDNGAALGVPPIPGVVPPQGVDQQPQQPGGRECKIPSLSRRLAAEFLDFLLVFSVKLIVSIIAVDNGLNLFQTVPATDVETLLTMAWDPSIALSITSELVIMEVINRVFICIFESVCISSLGATPGKRMMGIRVIACEELVEMPGNRIRILPAGNIGFGNSLIRAAVKNFSLAFFFPVCLTVFFFPHNRTGYDVLSSSIVVELPEDDIWAMRLRR
jgi:uncharacterized RDD family membrane protein YckC